MAGVAVETSFNGWENFVEYTWVLVHGLWHYGSLWHSVASRLSSHGHTVYAPTLAGVDPLNRDRPGNRDRLGNGDSLGDHPPSTGQTDTQVTYVDQVASITDYILDRNLTNIVLVGHSYGGVIISGVAMAMPERIRRLVFHNALIVRDGHSVLDELPPSHRSLDQPSNGYVPVLPYPQWRDTFIGDADEDLATSVYNRLVPSPAGPLAEPLNMKRFYSLVEHGNLRCSYLNATEDVALPPDWGWHPRFSSRLAGCRLVQMRGSHEVMFSQPAGLAARLIEAARD